MMDDEITIPSDFEIDISIFVSSNHKTTVAELRRLCEVEIDDLRDSLSDLDYETIFSAQSWTSHSYDELEGAANQLALVALIARLDTWLRKLVRKYSVPKANLAAGPYTSGVAKDMANIQSKLDTILPVSIEYFDSLVTVRDAIIHGDGHRRWDYNGKMREVASCYASPYGSISFTKEDLEGAVSKSIVQYQALEIALEVSARAV